MRHHTSRYRLRDRQRLLVKFAPCRISLRYSMSYLLPRFRKQSKRQEYRETLSYVSSLCFNKDFELGFVCQRGQVFYAEQLLDGWMV